jgi:hypothetical protein
MIDVVGEIGVNSIFGKPLNLFAKEDGWVENLIELIQYIVT